MRAPSLGAGRDAGPLPGMGPGSSPLGRALRRVHARQPARPGWPQTEPGRPHGELSASGRREADPGPRPGRAEPSRQRHHVLAQAAQTHVQVLPPAAAPGKQPSPRGALSSRFRGAARGQAQETAPSPVPRPPDPGAGKPPSREPRRLSGNLQNSAAAFSAPRRDSRERSELGFI